MKIGLFGGSFNPPHIGHLRAAKIFCEKAGLDVLYVVPAFVSPFKENTQYDASDKQRFEMTKLCFEALKKSTDTEICVSDIEISKEKTSYTIDTVNEILQISSQSRICMLVGSDMFCSLERWKSFEELFSKCDIFTIARETDDINALSEFHSRYSVKYNANTIILKDCPLTVSSTDIRGFLRNKEFANLQNLLTAKVLRYIIEHGLYDSVNFTNNNFVYCNNPTTNEVLEKIRADMPLFLSSKRLKHTLSVENQAIDIAKMLFAVLKIDEKYINDVRAAALLHDFTKKLDIITQKELCVKYSIPTDSVSCDSCNLLHSKTAAFLSRERYGINDNVFYAVYNHTTGCENMSVIDKIIFLSDFIEPTRTQAVCKKLHDDFYSDIEKNKISLKALDRAVLSALDSTINYLVSISQPIDLQTIKARNSLTANATN